MLQQEEEHKNHTSQRHYKRGCGLCGHFQTFHGRKNRDGRCDDSVSVKKACAQNTGEDD